MSRMLSVVLVLFVSLSASADPPTVARTRNALSDVMMSAGELSKEAQRDAEVLRLLREAARSLDDWQANNAVSRASDQIGRAEQIAAQPPYDPRVRKAVASARAITDPAHASPSAEDLQRLRGLLQARSIDTMRAVVAEDVTMLAQLAAQLAEVSSMVTKAVAAATSTSVGSRSE